MDRQTSRKDHITAWRKSGLTQREYARNNGININTFAYWLSKDRHSGNQRFLEVTLPDRGINGKSFLSFHLRLGFLQLEYRREKE